MFSAADHEFMARALRLAERGLYSTSPNPRVGCVLVKDGVVVGEGWHERAGEAHAEVHALRAAGEAACGATAYVTLEPCSHHGRTPPCAEALIAARVARVVAAMQDPNPLVAGRGMALLEQAGIVAESGLMESEARELNIGFVSRMTCGRPWVRLKLAASLDGKTALENGVSQWITGPAARQDGHRWRARACAILSGIGTVREDDPRFNVRGLPTERQPLKVVLDSRLELRPVAKVCEDGNLLVATAVEDVERYEALRARGAEVVCLPAADGRVDLSAVLGELGRRGINEVHVEGGARLNGALVAAGLVDELLLYLAPCLLGDVARGMFGLPALQSLENKSRLAIRDARMVGDDLRILARFVPSVQG
ncbi:bifunctional diaminohydroxyphosphoribosylaminopyrimidine deaminase/5-amino-6-(5-phosphoribosylamino)uracil reductase RibD [Propionivibrio limicola]|uniref:bifunctional diaminohydroxyphosphoribosylaminopyrimidine deaminase/5-amino-6-(5-phosphoribosylamino)uracil reductase RibD n=1 Tax=Propionivibrio limicola TaxID=167645 RepID=UPI00129276CD|nr:bifunctional diaminohydroxyphosphoribosylaminopyrimidine deaminase/5-amino-6-(5-phosphoribosylamino)uracil reductase RibD [Propionivibrio limicola]